MFYVHKVSDIELVVSGLFWLPEQIESEIPDYQDTEMRSTDKRALTRSSETHVIRFTKTACVTCVFSKWPHQHLRKHGTSQCR